MLAIKVFWHHKTNRGKNLKHAIITFLFVTFSLGLQASSNDMEGATFSSSKPVDINVSFNQSTFETQPWTQEFRYVIVVNKAVSGSEKQTIKIFEYGQLIITSKVSTGRDQFESKGEHGSKMDAWTVTPTGYYTPLFLNKNHKSSAYGRKWEWLRGGVKMPYAIFFNGGIALHQRPKGTESALGENASGGCVRLSDSLASDLFSRVQETAGVKNPRFNVDGTPMLDAEGNLRHATNPGYSTLIVVQNQNID
jgi:lipoprotein-anchoring transpeptidase ErfK/SrfK